MKKLPLLINLLSAIAVTGANAEVPDLKEYSTSKPSADCSKWKSENLIDKSDSRLKFVKGISHCLQQVDRSDMSPSQSESEFREMHNRFYDVYDTLKDTEARVKFTLLFINQVSVLHKVGVHEIQNKNHALRFSYTLKNGLIISRLMRVTSNKENDYYPTERDYIKFGNSSGFTNDLKALVSYVINGNKKIQLKELDIDV